MATKTLGTVFIILICILVFPVCIGILGGMFGIIAGIFGVLIGIFGAIIGVFAWILKGLFHWHMPFGFFGFNMFAVIITGLVIALAIKTKRPR